MIAAVLLLAAAASAAQLPDTWIRCRRKDPNLDFCLRHAIEASLQHLAAGTPELDVLPLEPASVDGTATIQRKPGRISLQMRLSNIKTHGLSGAKVVSVFSDLDRGVIDMYVSIPVVQINADMEVEGFILHEPVSPQRGNVNFTFYDPEGFCVVSGRTVERKGDSFFEVQDVRLSVLSLGTFMMNFDQLDRTPQRSSQLNYLMNANALSLWSDIRDLLQTAHAENYRRLANLVFSKVSLKDIFLENDHPAVLRGPLTLLI